MINKKQELLRIRADLQGRLKLIIYDGTVEIKENASGKYLYIRKREFGKLKSIYVDKFSQELYQLLIASSKQAREIKKELRKVEKELALLGYSPTTLSPKIKLNLEFARINMKSNIYDQAILEGVATTYPQTETIIDNGKVFGMTATDVQKILNLKHAWEFILDEDVILASSDFYILSYIAKLVNEGFYAEGGQIRAVPVRIGGTEYIPPLPIEIEIKETIKSIISQNNSPINTAIERCLFCMKSQIFNDGNKRAAVIFANHYLISQGEGLIIIPEKEIEKFKQLLILYYEGKDDSIKQFLKDRCWKKF